MKYFLSLRRTFILYDNSREELHVLSHVLCICIINLKSATFTRYMKCTCKCEHIWMNNMHVHININPLHSIKLQFIYMIANFTKYYPASLKSIVYREKEQIIIKCLDDSFGRNIFVYIFIGWLIILWSKKIANACMPKVHMC